MTARVVFVDHCARLSGGELALLRLLRALGDAIDAHVILAEHGPLEQRLSDLGVSTEVLPLAPRALHAPRERMTLGQPPLHEVAATAAYVGALRRRLRRLRPDLVHANSLKSLIYGGVAARLAGVPAIWHVRDRIAGDYLPVAAVRGVGMLARAVPDAVIANSRTTLLALDRACGGRLRAMPCAVVHDPLDAVEVEQGSSRAGPLRIAMLGRIAPWKGQHVFLEAFAHAFRGRDVEAVFVGAPLFGEEGYECDLHRRARELSIYRQVEFAGFRENVAAELARVDVVVHASLLPEPLGQVVQEAMQARLPVVAAAAGGPAEIVDDGVTGILYPPGDAGALAERLTELARDAALRARLGAAAAERARVFAPEDAAAQVLSLYRRVMCA
jgi:glycosyltransferase involved in cell wall biosynthesis